MSTKMFGYRVKKRREEDYGEDQIPGGTGTQNPSNYQSKENNDEESYKYAKGKDFPPKEKGSSFGRVKDAPSGYEGKEHVKYRDPGHTRHHIRYPQDEPHMKSHVDSNEEHEMEDNYHMDIPDQTEYSLEKKIKRARMKMDAPDQEDPDALRGNMMHDVGYEGDEDTSGEEEMGPNDMQGSDEGSRKHKRNMVLAVMKRKMKKHRE